MSTNWRDDYLNKAGDYEEIGIPRILDCGIIPGWVEGGLLATPNNQLFRFIQLVEGEYQVSQFRKGDASGNPPGQSILSPTFPQLNLTVQEIFDAGLQS